MAIRNIIKEGDPVLRKNCRTVTDFNDRLHLLLDDMHDTLAQSGGVGLAAPQVGVLRRAVLVLETNVEEGEEEYVIELINPEIIAAEGEQDGPEGCLSVLRDTIFTSPASNGLPHTIAMIMIVATMRAAFLICFILSS